MAEIQKIASCLWFDKEAEEAVHFYTSIFPNSKIGNVMRYSEVGREIHRQEPGSVMTMDFELDGQNFTALNGGPLFRFSEAISFQVFCQDQAEVDYYWEQLSEGATRRRSSVAGSRTSSAYRGRSCRRRGSRC